MNKKYDLVVGLGAACFVTQILRKKGLQDFTYPFDWIFGMTFLQRVDCVCNNFAKFIEKDDLVFTGTNNNDIEDLCDVYENTKNHLIFNHDFPSGVDLEKSYEKVREKYDRRSNRLMQQIADSNKILVVYMETIYETDKLLDNSILELAYKNLLKAFPQKEFHIMYFSNVVNKKLKEHVSSFITKISVNYRREKVKDERLLSAINRKVLLKYFMGYKLKIPLFKQVKKTFLRNFLYLIPIKSWKKKYRKKFHIS